MTEESTNFDALTVTRPDKNASFRRRFPSKPAPTSLRKRHGQRIPTQRRWQARRARRKRGDDGLVELVICFPVFFLLVVLGIQFALWSHASHLARAAAEAGSQAASDYGASPRAGTQAAYSFIATTGGHTLTGPQVSSATLPDDVAQVTVTGRTEVLLPWLTLTVSATSVAPRQEYRASG